MATATHFQIVMALVAVVAVVIAVVVTVVAVVVGAVVAVVVAVVAVVVAVDAGLRRCFVVAPVYIFDGQASTILTRRKFKFGPACEV